MMADFHFARARTWAELVECHDRWVEDYNHQPHWAHRERTDGRRSPGEVLGWVSGVRYRSEDLERAFFSTRHSRVLDPSGHATFRRWRVYGDEALAREEAELWLLAETLTMEHGGQPLSRFHEKAKVVKPTWRLRPRREYRDDLALPLASIRALASGPLRWAGA